VKREAVVLFSGGLDSTVALCWALAKGYSCAAVSFAYGQRHSRENRSARAIARRLGVKLYEINWTSPGSAPVRWSEEGAACPNRSFPP